jgi:hypothetical protein
MKHGPAAIFALALIMMISDGASLAVSEEGLAYPEKSQAAAPKFISGDTEAEAKAAAGPNDWVQVSGATNEGRYVLRNYVHKGESAAHWTELVTYLNTPKPEESPADFMNRAKAAMLTVCPAATFAVLNQSDSEITYESRAAKCPQLGDQDEIVRVIYGQLNMFQISYTAKTADIPAAKRADMVKLLSGFQVREKS